MSRRTNIYGLPIACVLMATICACSGEKELSSEEQHRQRMTTERENFKALQSWVDESAKREKRALVLQGFLKNDFCKALQMGQRFQKLATVSQVTHNLTKHPPLPLSQIATPYSVRHIESPALIGSTREAFVNSMKSHFAIFGLVKVCDVHTHRFTPEPTEDIIQATVNLEGFDTNGHILEEHLTLELAFDANNKLRRFNVLEGYFVGAPQKLYQNITQSVVGSGQFPEAGFSPLKLGAAGNLDFGGLAVVDVNSDGLLDIYVARSGPNFLYLQEADGSFFEDAQTRGIADDGNARGVVFADMDADGDLDLIVANMTLTPESARPLQYYRQEQNGNFSNQTATALKGKSFISQFSHVAIADVDGDQDLDVFVAGYGNSMEAPANHIVEADNGQENILLINNGSGIFSNEAQQRGLRGTDWSYAASFADVDRDGDQDLYVANDWGINRFYVNDGQGNFREAAAEYNLAHPGAGMGVLWTDIDGNGELDLYVSNMFSNAGNRILPFAQRQSPQVKNALLASAGGNHLFLNPKPGGTVDGTENFKMRDGGWAWGAIAFDYDLDGDEDIYQTNGYFTGTRTKDL